MGCLRPWQARLRHGADRWDTPELLYDTKYANDQSALLWTEGNVTWLWGGGGKNGALPFKVAVTTDSGGSWRLHVPTVTDEVGPTPLASQPITTAFRGAEHALCAPRLDPPRLCRTDAPPL